MNGAAALIPNMQKRYALKGRYSFYPNIGIIHTTNEALHVVVIKPKNIFLTQKTSSHANG